MTLNNSGANKQFDSRSAADARAHEILESSTVHNDLRYDVGMLWEADNTKLPNIYLSSLVQLKSLEKRLANVYQYTLYIFGAKDSPTCANYALQSTARDHAKFYPEAAKAVLENFYMDDYLDSVESPEKAINRLKELVHLLHLDGFKLTKFVRNVPSLADRIDGSPLSTEPKVIVSRQEDSSHVLGLKWDHTYHL